MLLIGAMQLIGGAFYLLNKVFLSRSERTAGSVKRKWKILSWLVYILGLPFWIYILGEKHNWIALAVEISGAPSMILGLVFEFRNLKPVWLDKTAIGTVILGTLASVAGFIYSVSELGGITSPTQIAEVSLAIGFLAGTYLLASQRPAGYLWFQLMSGSAIILFYLQDQIALTIFQVLSVILILDANKNRKLEKQNEKPN